MKILIPLEISDEEMTSLASDLITTAVEGGINYWASVSDYAWDGVPTTVTVHDLEDEDGGVWTITTVEMTEAIRKLLTGEVPVFYNMGYTATFKARLADRIATGDTDEFDYDAIDADCMMQIACMGEVVYG